MVRRRGSRRRCLPLGEPYILVKKTWWMGRVNMTLLQYWSSRAAATVSLPGRQRESTTGLYRPPRVQPCCDAHRQQLVCIGREGCNTFSAHLAHGLLRVLLPVASSWFLTTARGEAWDEPSSPSPATLLRRRTRPPIPFPCRAEDSQPMWVWSPRCPP